VRVDRAVQRGQPDGRWTGWRKTLRVMLTKNMTVRGFFNTEFVADHFPEFQRVVARRDLRRADQVPGRGHRRPGSGPRGIRADAARAGTSAKPWSRSGTERSWPRGTGWMRTPLTKSPEPHRSDLMDISCQFRHPRWPRPSTSRRPKTMGYRAGVAVRHPRAEPRCLGDARAWAAQRTETDRAGPGRARCPACATRWSTRSGAAMLAATGAGAGPRSRSAPGFNGARAPRRLARPPGRISRATC